MSKFRLNKIDAVEWLSSLEDNSVDLVVTDPPYESLEKYRKQGTTTRLKKSEASSNEWFKIFPNERFKELFEQIYRVLKKNRHFYLFCDQETMFVAKPIAEEVGFKFWKPLVWGKCLDPETLVMTTNGVKSIKDISTSDEVFTPDFNTSKVLAKRTVKQVVTRIKLSDGTVLTSSNEHRYVLRGGNLIEAHNVRKGDQLYFAGDFSVGNKNKLYISDIIPNEKTVLKLPSNNKCLWCDKEFNIIKNKK